MSTYPIQHRRWTRAEYDRLISLGILHEDEKVELLGGRILLRGAYPARERPWSRAEYERLVDLGLFKPGERIELVGGEMVVREPQGGPHALGVERLGDALRAAFGPGWRIRIQLPVALEGDSEPEPDISVVRGSARDADPTLPSHPVLVAEVAESSLAFDREQKGSLYARARVPDYWIVNLPDRVLEVYRDPAASPAAPYGWTYATCLRLGPGEAAAPLATPTARIPVADLLP